MSSTSQGLKTPSSSSTASRKSPRKPVSAISTSQLPASDLLPDGSVRIDGPYESVWDAIESDPGDRERMKVMSELMDIVEDYITRNEWTQKQAAKHLGVTQPRISDLMRGKISLFSIDSLVAMAGKAGLQLTVGLKPPKA